MPLYEDVGHNGEIVYRFVSDYLTLLDGRLTAIRDDLANGNHETAIVGLLSLETTSVMIGAREVADATRAVRNAVEGDDLSTLPPLLNTMVAETAAIRSALAREGYSARG
jgi:hypothetical protein